MIPEIQLETGHNTPLVSLGELFAPEDVFPDFSLNPLEANLPKVTQLMSSPTTQLQPSAPTTQVKLTEPTQLVVDEDIPTADIDMTSEPLEPEEFYTYSLDTINEGGDGLSPIQLFGMDAELAQIAQLEASSTELMHRSQTMDVPTQPLAGGSYYDLSPEVSLNPSPQGLQMESNDELANLLRKLTDSIRTQSEEIREPAFIAPELNTIGPIPGGINEG